MNKSVFILCFIADAQSAIRYWHSEEGRLFFQGLIKSKIDYVIYLKRNCENSVWKLPWVVSPEAIDVNQLDNLIDGLLQRYEAVFIISDSQEAIFSLPEKEGCLPYLLTSKGKLNFESDNYIESNTLLYLNAYFEEPLPYHLLMALRRNPESYAAELEVRNARIKKQIEANGGVYIFGADTVGQQVHDECIRSEIKVLGFVDNDLNKQQTKPFNLPVLGPTILDPTRDVVVLASGNHSYDIYKQLKSLNFLYIQNLPEFFYATNCPAQPEPFFHQELWQNRIRYHTLYMLLSDAASRNVLEAIVEYRQSFELFPLVRIRNKQNLQWFDKAFFTPNPNHVFIDGGGYDGDTALQFIATNDKAYRSIHVFEIDSFIAERAAANLKPYEHVYVHNLGLSNKSGTLFFTQTGRTDGHLVQGKGIPVKVDSIDNVVKDKITILKLDVEGAEVDAIAGAACHIRDESPMLAIAVYHKAEDLWAVPRQILSISPNYVFSLRHYTQVTYETVIYGLHREVLLEKKEN